MKQIYVYLNCHIKLIGARHLPTFSIIGYYLVLFYICRPGFVNIDDIAIVNELHGRGISGWGTLFYSLILRAFVTSNCNFAGMSLLTLSIFFVISAWTLNLLSRSPSRLKWIHISSFMIFCLLPINQIFLLHQTRDIIFSLALCGTGLYFYICKKNKNPLFIFLISTTVIFLADLRQEAKIFIPLFPFYAWLLKLWGPKQIASYLIFTIPLSITVFLILPSMFEYNSYSQRYLVTTYVQPLSEIYATTDALTSDPVLNQSIDQVLDTHILAKHFDPENITPIQFGAWRGEVNIDTWSAFRTSAVKIYFRYYTTWIRNRMRNILGILNLTGEPRFLDNEIKIVPIYDPVSGLFGWTSSQRPVLFQNYIEELYDILKSKIFFFRFLINGTILPLIFLSFAVTRYKKAPKAAFASLVALSRLPVLFALSPANFIKYSYSIPLMATFLVPVYLSQMHHVEKLKFCSKKS